MKEKIYCHWLPIAIGIMGIGFGCDVGVKVTGFALFTVSESYMDYLFAAIVSVGLLGFSLIALVSGLLQEKFYGYKLSELLVFVGIRKRINLRKYLIVSLVQVVLGILYLSLFFRVSCVNSMIYLLISAVFSAGCMAYSIFDIMVNNQAVYDILEEGYGSLLETDLNKNKKYLHHVTTLSNALINAAESGNLEETEEICSLYAILLKIVDKKSDVEWGQSSFLRMKLKEVCCSISRAFGYLKMLEEITKMFCDISNYDYWKTELYLQPISDLKYYDDEKLEKYDYRNQVLEICVLKEYKAGFITDNDWKDILYEYFSSLIKNKSCTEEIKHEILNKFLAELLNFTRNSEGIDLSMEEKVALHILNYILNLNNMEEQKKIYAMFLRNITVHNQYRESKDYFLFLSIMFQVLYAYAYLEREVRTEKYRKNIRQLVDTVVSDNMINGLKISFLLEADIERVLKSFGYRIPKDLPIVNSFEASADFIQVKYIIWTEEYNIKFFFMLYCMYYDHVGIYSVFSFLQWDTYTNETKNKILKLFVKCFDKDSGMMNDVFLSECRQLGELYNHNYEIKKEQQIKIYEFIQEQQRNLIDIKMSEKEVDEEGRLDTKEIAKYLNDDIKRNRAYGWNPDRNIEFYIKYSDVKAIMHYENIADIVHEKTVAHFIKNCGYDVVNWFIKNKCKKITPTYNMEGIQQVLKCIEDNNFSIKNFSYALDMALDKYSGTDVYQKLSEKENEIELCTMNFIHEHIYAKSSDFYFKFLPSKARMRYLNESECLERLEKFERYKEYYYVDGALLDRKRAIECIKRKYFAYEFDFKVYLDFKPEDVTWFGYPERDEG